MTKKVVASIVLLSTVIVGGFYLFRNDQSNIVAKVNGKLITVKEFKYFMYLNKAKIYNYYYRSFNIDYSESFWQKKIQGKTPLQKLKKQSLEDAATYKVQQLIAREKGVSVTIGFDSLMNARQRVNEARKHKVKRGQPVYGPIVLTVRNYIKKRQDIIVQKTKKILSRGDFKISCQEMKYLQNNYKEKADSSLKDSNSDRLSSFKRFKVLYQNEYTNNRYKKLIQKLKTDANIEINHAIYNEIDIR